MKVERRRQVHRPRGVEGDSGEVGAEVFLSTRVRSGVSIVRLIGLGRMSSVEVLRIPRLTDLSTKTGCTLVRSPTVL
jgi:hypothetical protein